MLHVELCKGTKSIRRYLLRLEDASREYRRTRLKMQNRYARIGVPLGIKMTRKVDSCVMLYSHITRCPLPYLYSTYYFRNYPKPVSWPTANRTCSRVVLLPSRKRDEWQHAQGKSIPRMLAVSSTPALVYGTSTRNAKQIQICFAYQAHQ
jgi:hypothetical protein